MSANLIKQYGEDKIEKANKIFAKYFKEYWDGYLTNEIAICREYRSILEALNCD